MAVTLKGSKLLKRRTIVRATFGISGTNMFSKLKRLIHKFRSVFSRQKRMKLYGLIVVHPETSSFGTFGFLVFIFNQPNFPISRNIGILARHLLFLREKGSQGTYDAGLTRYTGLYPTNWPIQ
jgi:hypothetical protein